MADRSIDEVATIYTDLPGGSSDTIELTITDPLGTIIVDAEVVPVVAQNRFAYTTATELTIPGVYRADWHYTVADNIITQYFTVGKQPLTGITKYQLRYQIASRVSPAWVGEVYSADTQSIVDHTLIGQPEEYILWWVMTDPASEDAGRIKRVTGYNGSALEISPPFIAAPVMLDSYTLFAVSPREIDNAMRMAINELSNQARIELRINDIQADEDDIITIPNGVTHISEVWGDNEAILPATWRPLPGRRIIFETLPDEPIDLIGIRQAGFPLWEDSIVETDPTTTVARAANLLHASRAGGAAVDPEEHLRRQLAAADDFERARRTSVGRIPPGTRPVLE
jgi:hypothetical protein